MTRQIIPLLLLSYFLSFSLTAFANENPFFNPAFAEPDGRLGMFSQNNTGDCFFLASLIAIAEDSNGRQLIESAFYYDHKQNLWRITFPNLPNSPIEITTQEIKQYQLKNSKGDHYSAPVWGDPDVKMLEIAADQIWKHTVKKEGLWDDVPMNALSMFSNTEQLLIWNRSKASVTTIVDIDKYKRPPKKRVKEITVSSAKEVLAQLKAILAADTAGISIILIDYITYHADVITQIDFSNNTFSLIDSTLNIHSQQNLATLLQRVANGQYALNYIEIQ